MAMNSSQTEGTGSADGNGELNDEMHKLERMLQKVERAQHEPFLVYDYATTSRALGCGTNKSITLSSVAGDNSKEYDYLHIHFNMDKYNSAVIVDPMAILEVLVLDSFLKSDLSEESKCRILDCIIELAQNCVPNNAHALKELLVQPIEYLKIEKGFLLIQILNWQKINLRAK